ncbi:MAG: hypothetical protein KDD09_26110, partial [Phaeodactylibacter sp.]|nr:hypothetical protein [Phaeodactylibacter sp.]
KFIGCDTSNLRYIELDQRVPQTKTREKIQDYINAAFSFGKATSAVISNCAQWFFCVARRGAECAED